MAQSLDNLAKLRQAQGEYAEAERLFTRSLAIYEQAPETPKPQLAMGLERYAALLRATGRGEEAEKLMARARTIRAEHALNN